MADGEGQGGRQLLIGLLAACLVAIVALVTIVAVRFFDSENPAETADPGATGARVAVGETGGGNGTPAGAPPPPQIVDADAHGFVVFGTGARCFGADEAEMFMRTDKSALVVCTDAAGRLYYRGYRIADGASIDLYDVTRQPGTFTAINTPDNAQYVITATGFRLIQNGAVVVDEHAIETGPAGWAERSIDAPAQDATPPVVLGSAAPMGPSSRGYGTERPSVISMGSCPNAVSTVVWQDWGAPVAHGSGLGCVQSGPSPRYDLVASDIGDCQGVLAYRWLQIGDGWAQDICNG